MTTIDQKLKILKRAEGRKLRQDEKAKLNGPPILLAKAYDPKKHDPTGWWWSEKLDGVRAYWDGQNFISRQGKVFEHCPDWFKQGLPEKTLDGELWMNRRSFQETISIIKNKERQEDWKNLRYVVFDAPYLWNAFENRICDIPELIKGSAHSCLIPMEKVKSKEDLERITRLLVDCGAEGIMLRQPGSLYEAKRSSTLLKVKLFSDAEAEVIEHQPGEGKHKGRLGALKVQMPNGKQFFIGTGFSDADRESPPLLGATITYRFTELTKDGIPKCASFVAVRDYE